MPCILSLWLAVVVVVAKGRGSRALCQTYVGRGGIALKVGLDGLVLLVEVRQVRDEVLDDVGVRERVDLDIR